MNRDLAARFALLAGAALFSTGGLAIKITDLTGWQVSSFRSGLAAVLIFVLVPGARRVFDYRIWLVAIPYAATFTLYVLGNKYTTAAHTIFLQSTAPLYLLVLAPLVLGESVRRQDIWFMLALATGLVLLLASPGEPAAKAPHPLRGDLLATGAGFCWALTLLGLRWLAKEGSEQRASPLAAVVAGNIVACAVGLYPALPVGSLDLSDWLPIFWLGAFQVSLAYVLVTLALGRVPALQASMMLLLEPVLNPLWVWLVLGETPGGVALAGGGLIVCATALLAAAPNVGRPP